MTEMTNTPEPAGVTITASLTPPPSSPTIQIQPPAEDNTMGLIVKMATAVLAAPKVSAYLATAGITIDPAMASLFIAGLLHKGHQILKQATGWSWL